MSSHPRLSRLLRWPLQALPPGLWLPILRGPASGFRWRVGSATHSCWLGIYESDLVRIVVPRLPTDVIAYDLGAHAGYYTLFLAPRFTHVHAFEPSAADLRAHVDRNGLASRVTIHEHAVSDVTGPGYMA